MFFFSIIIFAFYYFEEMVSDTQMSLILILNEIPLHYCFTIIN
jgi:hypothetical protein